MMHDDARRAGEGAATGRGSRWAGGTLSLPSSGRTESARAFAARLKQSLRAFEAEQAAERVAARR